uniref:Glycosyltransferase family 92 protein n=1 Tax=Oryzias latipes TaxID=8090 RepID=A0A3P9LHU0_ORYLA
MSNKPRQWLTLKMLRCLVPVFLILAFLSVLLLVQQQNGISQLMNFQLWTRPYPEQKPCTEETAYPERVISFAPVKNTKTLLLSAYQEHRTNKKEVRVIAVVLRSEKAAYRCIFNCQEQQHISEGVSNIHKDHFRFPYGTADIMCPIPSGCVAPTHIAVVRSAANYSQGMTHHELLEIRNQKVQSDGFAFNFTVCFSTMFNFTNVLQLVQSLTMLELLGVNRVVIYKTDCSPETQRILDYYVCKGFVELIPWSLSKFINVSYGWLPEHGPGQIHYVGQIPALNDCLYRYMYKSRYVALNDMDELILPQTVNSWLELLPLLEKKYGVNKCYRFQNNVFPKDVVLPPPPSAATAPLPPLWKNLSGVNILDHLYQEPLTKESRYIQFKIIVNPRAVFSTSVHGVLSSQKGCVWVQREIARMYHTRDKRQPELKPGQLLFDGRLLSYSASLIQTVNAVLRENGLLPAEGKL